MRQYVIFIEPRKFDTTDIKCFTVRSGHRQTFDVINFGDDGSNSLAHQNSYLLQNKSLKVFIALLENPYKVDSSNSRVRQVQLLFCAKITVKPVDRLMNVTSLVRI